METETGIKDLTPTAITGTMEAVTGIEEGTCQCFRRTMETGFSGAWRTIIQNELFEECSCG
jgi:hypothetical protein